MLGSMAKLAQENIQFRRSGTASESPASHRQRSLNVLFLHRDADEIDCCLRELEKAQFTVRSDFVLNLAQCAAQLRTQSYDVIVVEYPSLSRKGQDQLHLLHQTAQETPLIFVTNGSGNETTTELLALDVLEHVERQHLDQLPMAVRRVLKVKRLRAELEEAERARRHSESQYRALADNPAYGICRCNAEGKFLDANQALAMMLGYSSREELLAANRASAIVFDLGKEKTVAGKTAESVRIESIESEWKRKNGTMLKVRLSGHGVYDEHGEFVSYEIIAVDITEQRALEEHLRRQAWSDSLTGLANHGRLFDVLHAEICRSKRTEREFSLVLLDLDGLKEINDRYGHLVGNRALCRLGQILGDCCRSVDTAARQGGDEFALVLPESSAAAATLVARRICDLLSKDAEEPLLSVSVGVATYPRDAETIGTLLYAADRDLYAMKEKRPKVARAGQVS
jgi:diguanylate cyclase (GGDEF)-like protein/PAS domain S-box-containing protein